MQYYRDYKTDPVTRHNIEKQVGENIHTTETTNQILSSTRHKIQKQVEGIFIQSAARTYYYRYLETYTLPTRSLTQYGLCTVYKLS